MFFQSCSNFKDQDALRKVRKKNEKGGQCQITKKETDEYKFIINNK